MSDRDQAVAENGDDAETEQTIPQLVFQCAKCKIIVGDSMAFSCSSKENKSITLAKACNVTHSSYIITAKGGDDVGCSYVNFFCSNCDEELGKFYCTTSLSYDAQRDKFTFSTDQLTSYELGKNQLGKMPEKQDLKNLQQKTGPDGASSSSASSAAEAVTQAHFEEEIFKIEKVLLNLVERMDTQETRSAEVDGILLMLQQQGQGGQGQQGARKRSVPF